MIQLDMEIESGVWHQNLRLFIFFAFEMDQKCTGHQGLQRLEG